MEDKDIAGKGFFSAFTINQLIFLMVLVAVSSIVGLVAYYTLWGTAGGSRASASLVPLLIATLAVVITGVLGALAVMRVSKPLRQLSLDLGNLEHPDVNTHRASNSKAFQEVHQLEEVLGTLLDQATHNARDLVEICSAAQGISGVLGDENERLISQVGEQSGELKQALEKLDQVKTFTNETTEHTALAQQIAHDSQGLSKRGTQVLQETNDAMSAISDSSAQISEITNMIDSIAFETNLLALNAAVEAARAGDQGRGFAVVATEVRNLAQRSAGFANEIKTLVESSVKRVQAGALLVNESGITLKNIVRANEDVNNIVLEIARVTSEQSNTLKHLQQSMQRFNTLNSENAKVGEKSKKEITALQNKIDLQNKKGQLYDDPINYPDTVGNQSDDEPEDDTTSLSNDADIHKAA